MKLLEAIKLDDLQHLQDVFSDATGLATITIDLDGKPVTKPSNFTEFYTSFVKNSKEGAKAEQDIHNLKEGCSTGYAGIMIFLEKLILNEQHLGYILGGQVFLNEPNEEELRELARKDNFSEAQYISAAKKVPIRTEKSMKASAELLKTIISCSALLHYDGENRDEILKTLKDSMVVMMESSSSIASKTKELEKISKQQNILSLNASIEAARAGEAGSGFAIVANQMGKLAAQSAEIYTTIIEDANGIHKSADALHHTFETK